MRKATDDLLVTVTFRHVDPDGALRDYATEKIRKVSGKYLRRAQEAHVVLSVNKRRHEAEINIRAAHFDISAHSCTGDLHSAVDAALGRVETQLRKHKDRINHHKGHQPANGEPTRVPVDVIVAEEPEGDGEPSVVENDNIPAQPLSVDDAILQLELSHADFLVFRNSANESISVIYKRRDGNYGLIAPNT